MNQWNSVMDQIQDVRQAQEDFLFRGFIDEHIIGPMLLDRLAADLRGDGPPTNVQGKIFAQRKVRPTDDEDER